MPQHVWVDATGRWARPDDVQPGLLLEWRQDPKGRWEGLVVIARTGPEWMPAYVLRPAYASPGTR